MNLKPLGDRVIIKQDEAEETTASGLILTSNSKEKPQRGKVIAVGEGKYDHGKLIPISVKPGDTVIFSSNPIPGNEKAVSKVINELSMKGAKVIFQDVHVSGHACQEEIKLIYSLVKPKYAIPVHGEYRHLTAQKNIVMELGIPKENVFVLAS